MGEGFEDERPLWPERAEHREVRPGVHEALAEVLDTLRRDRAMAADAEHAVVHALATALEARDSSAREHSAAVHRLAVAVAGRLAVSPEYLAEIRAVALLHDIGKIGLSDEILTKTGELSARERELVREHPLIGERILRPFPGLAKVADAVRHERERWDGSGYPDGLAGEAIPLASRVVQACEAFHAMTTDRPYRRALTRAEALERIARRVGTDFDADVVEALAGSVADGEPRQSYEPVEQRPRTAVWREVDLSWRHDAELRSLIAVTAAVAAAPRLEEVLSVAAEESRRALGAASVSIVRLDAGERLRTLATAKDARFDGRAPVELPLERRLLDEQRTHLVAVDSTASSPEEVARLKRLGQESALGVPIVYEGTAWGSILATSAPAAPRLGARQARFLEAIAGQLAVALGRSQLFSRIAALAFEDPLTGLANRRALDESVEAVVERALEAGSDVSLLFCDVDRLKEINDVFGHDAGDRALVEVAEVLSSVARHEQGSLVARIGGDEFCVVLTDASVEAARRMARRASNLLAELGPPAVTMSSGAASLRSGARDAADLFRAADAAQYAAKRAGRGTVFVADEGAEAELGERTALGRRTLRDRHASELQRQLGVTTALLDEVLAEAPVTERLVAVAEGLAQTLDAAEWGISFVPAGRSSVSLLRAGYRRAPEGADDGLVDGRIGEDSYGVGDFPLIARLVVGGGARAVSVDDPSAEEAEVAFLEEWGYAGVLAAAAGDEAGTYLVELFADEGTLELGPAIAQLRLLVLAAVSTSGTRVRS